MKLEADVERRGDPNLIERAMTLTGTIDQWKVLMLLVRRSCRWNTGSSRRWSLACQGLSRTVPRTNTSNATLNMASQDKTIALSCETKGEVEKEDPKELTQSSRASKLDITTVPRLGQSGCRCISNSQPLDLLANILDSLLCSFRPRRHLKPAMCNVVVVMPTSLYSSF